VSSEADERFDLVLSEALRSLTQQQSVLDNLRARATVLLSTAALASSFLGAPVLAGKSGLTPASIAALAALAAVLILTITVCLPVWRWNFRARPSALLQAIDGGYDIDSMRRHLAVDFEHFIDSNDRLLGFLQWIFTLSAILVTTELSLWLLALLQRS
jgi:hypothetical protein